MDSIKIIKKHGQPGGLPTVTVYVAEDAPGEFGGEVELYLHQLTMPTTSPFGSINIISKDKTPWVRADLVAFLKDNNYTSTSSAFTLAPFSTAVVNSNKIRTAVSIYYKESTNKVIFRSREFSFNIVDNAISISPGGVLVDFESEDLIDTVTKIQGVD